MTILPGPNTWVGETYTVAWDDAGEVPSSNGFRISLHRPKRLHEYNRSTCTCCTSSSTQTTHSLFFPPDQLNSLWLLLHGFNASQFEIIGIVADAFVLEYFGRSCKLQVTGRMCPKQITEETYLLIGRQIEQKVRLDECPGRGMEPRNVVTQKTREMTYSPVY